MNPEFWPWLWCGCFALTLWFYRGKCNECAFLKRLCAEYEWKRAEEKRRYQEDLNDALLRAEMSGELAVVAVPIDPDATDEEVEAQTAEALKRHFQDKNLIARVVN